MVLFVTSVTAMASYDAPTPLVAAVARAAEVAMPAPVTSAPAAVAQTSTPVTTTAPAPLVTVPPLPVTVPPLPLPPLPIPTTVAPAPPPAPRPAADGMPAGGKAPYLGLGTWVDVYDWSNTYTNGRPTVSPGDVDRMADAGVQTLYIQASKHDAPTDVLEPELLQAHIDRAQARGLWVVAWYLPTLVDPGRDLQRLRAVAGLRNVDSLAVDIEARNVTDVNDRNRRLIDLSAALRRALPGTTIAGIVLPPVVMEVVNTNFWPAFPYREIAPHYDVWMTMGYWTNRTNASGYRDAYRYTKENVDRLRNNLGQPDAPVHPIGGIGHSMSGDDVEGYRRAVADVRGLGGSIYDWHTTAGEHWDRLRSLRS